MSILCLTGLFIFCLSFSSLVSFFFLHMEFTLLSSVGMDNSNGMCTGITVFSGEAEYKDLQLNYLRRS